VDQKVLEAQQWVNSTYANVSGYAACPEDGNTGWATMYSLTMGLQHELGITTLSASFGPTTLSDLASHGDIGPSETNKNLVNIVQYGLFCKGYWGGAGDGIFDLNTAQGVLSLKSDAGLGGDGGLVQPKVFKAILTMDAYVLLAGGSNEIRSIQQWLNSRYFDSRDNFYLIPCDGHFSRSVQTALMQAIQYELGVPTDSATGNFGSATQNGLRLNPVGPNSTGVFVQLFSAAMVFNGASSDFTSSFDSNLASDLAAFQKFSALDQSGICDYRTWCQLLVSMGDADRPGGRFQVQ
jgi:peptidoglycan hydrolase-like protein with peptidoglycan-binding domain